MNEPVPFKLSRESRIRIDTEGHFWHEGERVEHERLARGLASWIALDGDTDRYVLRNALDWCFITVDDAPFVVRSVSTSADATTIELLLSDGTSEPLDPSTLRIDADEVPYCDVKETKLPARFSRAAAFGLLQHAHVDASGYVLTLGTRTFLIRRVARGEGAPHREPAHPDAP